MEVKCLTAQTVQYLLLSQSGPLGGFQLPCWQGHPKALRNKGSESRILPHCSLLQYTKAKSGCGFTPKPCPAEQSPLLWCAAFRQPLHPCSKSVHRPRDHSWGRRPVGGQKALPTFRCWKLPEWERSDCQVRVAARKKNNLCFSLFFFPFPVHDLDQAWPYLNQTKYFYCIIKIPCFNTLPCTNEVKQCRVQNCQIYKMIKQIPKASRDHAQRYQKLDIGFNFIV